ncbi:hypothetical protein ABT297_35140 [Dactylosporangium sp. NPDC000555]|uniref:hypothetical protein n=1 Tax=Dactylosporangium sp. NPDC000555 TaxID=3154260 RepID=UPI00332506E2
MRAEFWTPSGIRLRAAGSRQGSGNWLFLPGGPGIGSESLEGLVAAVEVPGASWLVDLPRDGSNTAAPGGGEDPFAGWPGVLLEAARSLPGAVFVGHSTGGMYLLSVPELEAHLTGLVLVSSAPHAGWLPAFAELTRQRPLPQDRIVDQTLWDEPRFGGSNVPFVRLRHRSETQRAIRHAGHPDRLRLPALGPRRPYAAATRPQRPIARHARTSLGALAGTPSDPPTPFAAVVAA